MATEINVRTLKVVMDGQLDLGFSSLVALTKQFSLPSNALVYAFGTAAGQINRLYMEERTIPLNSSDDVDLAGSLVGLDGATITFTKVKAVIIALKASPAAPTLVVGNEGTNPWVGFFGAANDTIEVRNGPSGGLFCNACGDATGWAVVAGTGDKLRIKNSDVALQAKYVLGLLGVG